MKTYSYQDCLEASYRVNWRIEELLADLDFNLAKRWLPVRLSGSSEISCLNPEEKLKLTQIEMGSYAHLFGYVEEFIAPKMTKLATELSPLEKIASHALTNMAGEEVKHMTLFRLVRDKINETLGISLKLIDGEKEVTQFVLGKNEGAVLLLITCIEWYTQYHYLSAIKEDENLDPLTKRIFRAHWVEESQHAKLDHNESIRAFDKMNPEEKEVAISDLIELVKSVDGLLQKQSQFDVENLSHYLGRIFNKSEKEEVYREILKSKRWVFIESGLAHPNFVELFYYVTTPSQRDRIAQAFAA